MASRQGNVTLATIKIRETVQFPKDYDLEALMKTFQQEHVDDHKTMSTTPRSYKVQGSFDKQGPSTLFFIPCRTCGFDREWYIKEALYPMERAIAGSWCDR